MLKSCKHDMLPYRLFVQNEHWHSHCLTFLFPDEVEVSGLRKNIGGSTDFAKKGTDRRFFIPLFTPLILI